MAQDPGYLTTDGYGNLSSNTGAASTIEDKQKQLMLQLQLSNMLRNKGTPDHGTMAGQVYIPPNPINQALDLYDHVQGIRNSQKSLDALTNVNNQKQGYTNDFVDQLLGRKKNKTASPVPAVPESTDTLGEDVTF